MNHGCHIWYISTPGTLDDFLSKWYDFQRPTTSLFYYIILYVLYSIFYFNFFCYTRVEAIDGSI